jgi:Family of unknown function (DUF6370)
MWRPTMRKVLALVAVGVLFSGLGFLRADDEGKKLNLKGEGLCAKCALKEQSKCQNVVIVKKEGEKDKKYYIVMDKVGKAAHQKEGFCQATKEEPVKVKITGTCKEEDGKLVFTAEKIEKNED